MNPFSLNPGSSRREFLRNGTVGIGAMALASLNRAESATNPYSFGTSKGVHALDHAPKAKQVIFLHMVGGPSQMDLFDPKPALAQYEGSSLPSEVTKGQKFAFVGPDAKVISSPYEFRQHGESGMVMSDLLPRMSGVVDDLCMIRSMKTDEINHSSGELVLNTGHRLIGRPSFGAWASYGLGSENSDLPAYVVLTNGIPVAGSPVWGAGFLPAQHQGVRFRGGAKPVFYLDDPEQIDRERRKRIVDGTNALNQLSFDRLRDPEISARIKQYELAYRMQTAVPDMVDLKDESQSVLDLYGVKDPAEDTYAKNCLLARRLVESGVRFVQIFVQGWDHHADIYKNLKGKCDEVDQGTSALITDLKQRGLLDETLIVWGGEFGRTPMAQVVSAGGDPTGPGRDHHKESFTVLMAGGGVKGGLTYGSTDDFGFGVSENPVHVHDWHATCLHLLGIDHERLTYKYQGLDARLTQVHGHVIKDLIA